MRLLFDQNISFRVLKKINDLFPDAIHVSAVDLSGVNDFKIWNFARENNCCIVTFDADFIDISNLKGFPPKIIWLRTGDNSTDKVASKLREESDVITAFFADDSLAFLEIS